EETPGDIPSRSGIAVGIVHGIDNPSAGIEKIFGRLTAGGNQTGRIAEQWFVAFCEIRDFSWPINHLLIDVHMVIGRPGSAHAVVPFSLKIHKHGTGARAGDHEVSSILKI